MQHHSDFGHLLVVDDNKVNRLLLARGLEEQGC
jgi:CheY-like chemotaxis protein